MPKCPSCSCRIEIRQMFAGDLRKLPCSQCSAIMSVKTQMGMLPAFLLIILGAPVAKAVQEGWFSITSGILGASLSSWQRHASVSP